MPPTTKERKVRAAKAKSTSQDTAAERAMPAPTAEEEHLASVDNNDELLDADASRSGENHADDEDDHDHEDDDDLSVYDPSPPTSPEMTRKKSASPATKSIAIKPPAVRSTTTMTKVSAKPMTMERKKKLPPVIDDSDSDVEVLSDVETVTN